MATAAKLIGRISPLYRRTAAKESTGAIRGLMAESAAEIPEGYALTPSGILVPWSNTTVPKGFVRQFESYVLEHMEKGSSLIYRMTKTIVGTAACGIALQLTWAEMTNPGHLQSYLPGPVQAQAAIGYMSVKAIVDEVNAKELVKFTHRFQAATDKGFDVTFVLVEMVLYEQEQILKAKGFSDADISDAQVVLADLLAATTAELLLQKEQEVQNALPDEPIPADHDDS